MASFVLGSKRTFDFLDNNPFVEFHPSDYVNDPFVIARHDDMVAINSALAVDLTGQVSADSIGTEIYSGFGGQVDFIRGAARSSNGKPIIALPSTARGGAALHRRPRATDLPRELPGPVFLPGANVSRPPQAVTSSAARPAGVGSIGT